MRGGGCDHREIDKDSDSGLARTDFGLAMVKCTPGLSGRLAK
jgi:hypothetical protein